MRPIFFLAITDLSIPSNPPPPSLSSLAPNPNLSLFSLRTKTRNPHNNSRILRFRILEKQKISSRNGSKSRERRDRVQGTRNLDFMYQ
jgi:hypothetical protein